MDHQYSYGIYGTKYPKLLSRDNFSGLFYFRGSFQSYYLYLLRVRVGKRRHPSQCWEEPLIVPLTGRDPGDKTSLTVYLPQVPRDSHDTPHVPPLTPTENVGVLHRLSRTGFHKTMLDTEDMELVW